MDWAQFVVQWLHVLLGIVWFGVVLYNALILIPALNPMPVGRQREIGQAIGAQAFKVIRPVAMAVIALGIIRGTVFGPIKGVDDLTTAYGITWLVALAFAIAAYFWGERMIGPALERMNAIPESEAVGPDGRPSPALVAALDRVKRVAVLELGIFFVIFTCMILMRFGL
jgi:uncharacterized membrane protein